jgi:hypothetical protein
MMVVRIGLTVLVLLGLVFCSAAPASDIRPATNRPDVMEIGDPVLISRQLLQEELERNAEMRSYVARYGWPDYAEVQEVTVDEPLAAYEVRLYYLRRNQQLSYSRVHVSSAFPEAGIRTYNGPIPADDLARILTARGEVEVPPPSAPPPAVAPVEPADVGVEPRDPSDEGIPEAVLRLEAAADRAALAAEMAERAAAAANVSAGRANAVLDKMIEQQ